MSEAVAPPKVGEELRRATIDVLRERGWNRLTLERVAEAAGRARSTLLRQRLSRETKIDVPVLVIHGTADRILPFDSTAARLSALIADCTLVPVEGGPHNVAWTHPDEVNGALLEFIAAKSAGDRRNRLGLAVPLPDFQLRRSLLLEPDHLPRA